MAFHVGQLVVCVDDSPCRLIGKKDLVRGKVYTIEGFDPETGTGVYLVGLPGEIVPPWKHPLGWRHTRFRPLDPKRIEVFTDLLANPPKEVVSA